MKIAGLEVAAGQYTRGSLPCAYLPDGSEVSVPLSILSGAKDGPTLLITSAIHGTELTGIEVIRRLLREDLKASDLRGTIVAAPIVNPMAYNAQQMNTPQDSYNLNRVFPGDPKSLLSHRLAHLIYSQLVAPCDYVIDLHANPTPAIQFAITKGAADPNITTRSKKMADAFGITTIEMRYEHEKHRTGTMIECAMADGKPSLVLELVYWRRIDPVSVNTGVRGIKNVLKSLDMLDGELEEQTETPVIKGALSRVEVTANKGGLVFWSKTAGDSISKGEVIGVLRDPWGDIVEEVVSPRDGWILAWPLLLNQTATTGDFLTFIAYRQE
jgi:predicted deacylase